MIRFPTVLEDHSILSNFNSQFMIIRNSPGAYLDSVRLSSISTLFHAGNMLYFLSVDVVRLLIEISLAHYQPGLVAINKNISSFTNCFNLLQPPPPRLTKLNVNIRQFS